jgi:hypothetical protein
MVSLYIDTYALHVYPLYICANVLAYSVVQYIYYFNSDYEIIHFHFMQYPLTGDFQKQRTFCKMRSQCRYIQTLSPFTFSVGRAIAHTVSRWLPTEAARVRDRVRSRGICGGQSDTRAGFLLVLLFPLPPIAPQSSS